VTGAMDVADKVDLLDQVNEVELNLKSAVEQHYLRCLKSNAMLKNVHSVYGVH